jgi:N-hydroxyarylamine O-acetyltransferase
MEYEITNWYMATHPDAPCATNIIAARPRPNRTRLTMFNERVNLRHADGGAPLPRGRHQ